MDRRITVTAKAIIALELFFMDFVLIEIINSNFVIRSLSSWILSSRAFFSLSILFLLSHKFYLRMKLITEITKEIVDSITANILILITELLYSDIIAISDEKAKAKKE